ncbi:MAG: ribosome silencing factor [Deltaproteobacteria bacterium]|nr:ribosome silencing factor [Deltaproteobacteria bacterium]
MENEVRACLEGEKQKSLKKVNSVTSMEKALLCARVGAEFKALDLVLLDVSRFTSFADFFVICSGKSSRQVQGIADNVEKSLRDHGIKPLGVEGRIEGQWILMDYGDVIIHIFYEPIRHFYDLESLWSEAKRVQWEEKIES